jgi:TonB family protein
LRNRCLIFKDMSQSTFRRGTAIAALSFVIVGNSLLGTSQTPDKSIGCSAEMDPVRRCPGRCPPVKLKLLHYVEPAYPPQARKSHVQGMVNIQALINENGEVKGPQLISGNPLLAVAAIEAVRKWRYQPACIEGGSFPT